MQNSEFEALQLKATIVPTQARWPEPVVIHWQKLHACVNEARERVAHASATIAEIDKNADLSPDGKVRQKRRVALEALSEFEKSNTLAAAK